MLNFINDNAKKIYALSRFIILFLSIESLTGLGIYVVFYSFQILSCIHVLLTFLLLGLGLVSNTLYFNNVVKNEEINASTIAQYMGISMIVVFASFLFVTIGEHKCGLTVLLYILILFIVFSCMMIKKHPPK